MRGQGGFYVPIERFVLSSFSFILLVYYRNIFFFEFNETFNDNITKTLYYSLKLN